jgi:hypothetical protein
MQRYYLISSISRMARPVAKQKVGRPFVGATPVIVRIPPHILEGLDAWREQEPDRPGRPEAIRRLVAQGVVRRRSKREEK